MRADVVSRLAQAIHGAGFSQNAQGRYNLPLHLLLVNASPELTGEAVSKIRPDVIQFHGNETVKWIQLVREKLKIEVWKALGVRDRHTLMKSARFEGITDKLLFDAPAKALPGGTGTSFDWDLLRTFEHKVDWGLAGGLHADNVGEALSISRAPLVDTSSGVESAAGIKDIDKINRFCQAVKQH